jgi:hypothetical protein
MLHLTVLVVPQLESTVETSLLLPDLIACCAITFSAGCLGCIRAHELHRSHAVTHSAISTHLTLLPLPCLLLCCSPKGEYSDSYDSATSCTSCLDEFGEGITTEKSNSTSRTDCKCEQRYSSLVLCNMCRTYVGYVPSNSRDACSAALYITSAKPLECLQQQCNACQMQRSLYIDVALCLV